MESMRPSPVPAAALSALALAVSCSAPVPSPKAPASGLAGIRKIQHVVMIMQENRSFDSYFGTFPGADGIPMKNGRPTVCVPDPLAHRCVRPFHDDLDRNVGGPHGPLNAIGDIDGGKMDGFIKQAFAGRIKFCARPGATNPRCAVGPPGTS